MRALTVEEVGQVVRTRRHELRLSQEALAERAGVARSSLGLIERGHPRAELDVLLRLLRALDLVMDLTAVQFAPHDDLDAHLASFDEQHTRQQP